MELYPLVRQVLEVAVGKKCSVNKLNVFHNRMCFVVFLGVLGLGRTLTRAGSLSIPWDSFGGD